MAATAAMVFGSAAGGAAAGGAAMTAGQALAIGAGTAVGGALLGKALAKTPDAPKPTLMPDPADQEKARKRALTEMISRSGRQSTILTDQNPGQKLGG